MILPTGSITNSVFIDEEVEIGKYTAIGYDVIFHGSTEHITSIDHNYVANYAGDLSLYSKGKIVIGSDVWIGSGVRILSGVAIGDGAIIGAGAVVASDVPPFAVVVGNPAQVMRKRFSLHQIKKLQEIRWWDWPQEKIAKVKQDE